MRVRVIGDEVPVARMVLASLRSESTGLTEFRRNLKLAGVILAVEVSRELEWEKVKVKTPLGVAEELRLARPPLLVAVLGAGVVMAEGFLDVYSEAPLGLVAARRVEEPGRLRVDVYYRRMPPRIEGPAVIVDPMLATGYTMDVVASDLKERGASKVIMASVIASRDGIMYLAERHPDAVVYTLAVDPKLDDRFFIVPGLGDAGDRSLGVEPG